jgi:hypothetical protein
VGIKSRKFAAVSAFAGILAGFLAHALFFHSHLHGEYVFLMSMLWIGVAVLAGATVLGIWRDARHQPEDRNPKAGC